MPLYMDYHFIPGITLEEAKKAHLKDMAVQAKYKVKYHQFWVNEQAGMAFCLMEAPDKESCAATHREANGVAACNIIEVDGGMYTAFMVDGQELDHGLVMKKNGEADSGYRFILTLDIIALTSITSLVEYEKLRLPAMPKGTANKFVHKYGGRIVQQLQQDSLVAVFITPESAVQCAIAIRDMFEENRNGPEKENWNIKYKMGISVGQPVTENEKGLFEKAIQQSSRLCKVADDSQIIVGALLSKLSQLAEVEIENNNLQVVNQAEQKFLDRLFSIIEGNITDYNFGVESLSAEIGVSRPHLYRKVRDLTGLSVVSFIRDFKMHKALYLLKEKQKNISEVALEVGISNPSYFAKCFQQKYGITPSKLEV